MKLDVILSLIVFQYKIQISHLFHEQTNPLKKNQFLKI